MKNKLIKLGALALLLCGLSFKSYTQEVFKRRNVHVELLGSGIFGSVNYDFLFKPGNDGFGMRVGLGYLPNGFVLPVGIYDLIGQKRVQFEYGLGIAAAGFFGPISQDLTFSDGIDNFGIIAYGKAGMRISPQENGLVFNIHWNPLINNQGFITAWFGLGIGYSWKKKL